MKTVDELRTDLVEAQVNGDTTKAAEILQQIKDAQRKLALKRKTESLPTKPEWDEH